MDSFNNEDNNPAKTANEETIEKMKKARKRRQKSKSSKIKRKSIIRDGLVLVLDTSLFQL